MGKSQPGCSYKVCSYKVCSYKVCSYKKSMYIFISIINFTSSNCLVIFNLFSILILCCVPVVIEICVHICVYGPTHRVNILFDSKIDSKFCVK